MACTILGLCATSPGAELPAELGDYRAYLRATELVSSSDCTAALSTLDPIWSWKPASPLLGRAALLAARCLQPAEAMQLLRQHSELLPKLEAGLVLARTSEAIGDTSGAAAHYQDVFYRYPLTSDAAVAGEAITRLRSQLGSAYPPVMPQLILERAGKLLKAGRQAEAKREYEAMQSELGSADRELARVRAATGDYAALSAISTATPAANAERLYLMHAVARRNSMADRAQAAVEELSQKHPKSPWRLEALVSWGNHYLLRNDRTSFEPLYRACATDFPDDPQAAYCDWKLVWAGWLNRETNAKEALARHLERFPNSEKASAALYYLGRHREVLSKYPLSYYATLSRKNQKMPATALNQGFDLSGVCRNRVRRAKLLNASGYPDLAAIELRYLAEQDSKPMIAAMELAELAAGVGTYDQSIRHIKSTAKGYLQMPLRAAPDRFWQLAFPLPYRASVESNCRLNGLDPHLVAALIRQESEFDPKAISRAKAYGLTQVMPATGRQLSRTLGLKSFQTSMLFEPEVNLRLGTHYLRSLLDAHGGKWEETLASYNAGKSRTDQWKTWGKFREPAEFIETIPFTETRNYVQVVLRNADIYRQIYARSH